MEDFVDNLLSESVSDLKSISDLKRSSKASVRQEEEIDQIIAKARNSTQNDNIMGELSFSMLTKNNKFDNIQINEAEEEDSESAQNDMDNFLVVNNLHEKSPRNPEAED